MSWVRAHRVLRELRSAPLSPRDGRLTDVIALACVAMVPMALAAHALLPIKYFADSLTLQSIAAGEYAPLNDTSFLYVGRLYAALGMANSLTTAAGLGLVLAMLALWAALRRARGTVTLPACFVVAVYVVLASVYLSQFSKDVWVLPVTLVVLLAPTGIRGELPTIAAVLLYAVFFRQYWLLILGIYVALRLATRWVPRRRTVLLTVIASTVAATLLAPAFTGAPLQSVRTSVNLDRGSSADAVTAIAPVSLGSGPVADSAENLITLGQLVVPGPLALKGSPVYLGYLLVIVALWAVFLVAVLGSRRRLLAGRGARAPDDRALRCALMVIAVLTTQSFFEPDYGSYLKHLTPVLPLLLAASVGWSGTPLLLPARSPGNAVPPAPADAAGRVS
jgi:hypothetical protein